jgi:uncharacterized protein YndB with AHSA1/START domain
MTPPLRVQIKLAATPPQVFAALTDSTALMTWFAEHAAVGLEAGQYDFWGRFTPENPDRAAGRHPIITWTAEAQVQYRWLWRGEDTLVDLRLHPRDGYTILAVEHAGGYPGKHQLAAYTLEDFWLYSLENLRRYLDGKPCDIRVDFSRPLTGDVTETVDIDASAARVFEVLTDPAEVERWMATRADINLETGKYDLGWGMPGMHLVDVVSNEKVAITFPEGDGRTMIVTWTLAEAGGKTRLTLIHSGFADDEDTGGVQAGWRNFIGWVRSIAEYGAAWEPALVALPPEAVAYPRVMHDLQHELVW